MTETPIYILSHSTPLEKRAARIDAIVSTLKPSMAGSYEDEPKDLVIASSRIDGLDSEGIRQQAKFCRDCIEALLHVEYSLLSVKRHILLRFLTRADDHDLVMELARRLASSTTVGIARMSLTNNEEYVMYQIADELCSRNSGRVYRIKDMANLHDTNVSPHTHSHKRPPRTPMTPTSSQSAQIAV